MKQTCFNSVAMKSQDSAEVLIYEQIGENWWTGQGVTASGFDAALKAVGSVKNIDIRINSPGGSVTHGVAIYDALVKHPAKKRVHIEGLAASMATVVAMAGDEINMTANSLFMVHEPRAGVDGTAEDMLRTATVLESISNNLVSTYAARTGRDPVAIKAEMAAETWFTAEQAKEAGYVTNITPRKELKAHFDPTSQFTQAPAWVQAQLACLKESPTMAEAAPATPEEKKPAAANAEAAAVDHDAIVAKAVKSRDERASLIAAKCALAGCPELAVAFIEDSAMSVTDVTDKLFQAMCQKNKPVGDGGSEPEAKAKSDENDKYRAEYKAEPAYAKSMTVEEYIAMRRVDDGLDPLKAPMNPQ